ncbi:hypothetical protein B566_EDAN011521 [Ephemera danica]|nr:hypothetical protein B566_EDAN011521 [Ephemera danica]
MQTRTTEFSHFTCMPPTESYRGLIVLRPVWIRRQFIVRCCQGQSSCWSGDKRTSSSATVGETTTLPLLAETTDTTVEFPINEPLVLSSEITTTKVFVRTSTSVTTQGVTQPPVTSVVIVTAPGVVGTSTGSITTPQTAPPTPTTTVTSALTTIGATQGPVPTTTGLITTQLASSNPIFTTTSPEITTTGTAITTIAVTTILSIGEKTTTKSEVATTMAGTTEAGTTVAGTTVAGTTVAGTTVAGTTMAGTEEATTTTLEETTTDCPLSQKCLTQSCLDEVQMKADALSKVPTTTEYPGNLALTDINGTYYYLDKTKALSYFDALTFCRTNGMDLVSIETQQEQNNINAHLTAIGLSAAWVYTSGNKIGSRCEYMWEKGETLEWQLFSYTGWAPGDPMHQSSQDCLFLVSGKWSDLFCSTVTYFMCEQRPGQSITTTTPCPYSKCLTAECVAAVSLWSCSERLDSLRAELIINPGNLALTDLNGTYYYIDKTKTIKTGIVGIYVFTSGNKIGPICPYEWIDGTPLSFKNWQTGEPLQSTAEECLITWYTALLAILGQNTVNALIYAQEQEMVGFVVYVAHLLHLRGTSSGHHNHHYAVSLLQVHHTRLRCSGLVGYYVLLSGNKIGPICPYTWGDGSPLTYTNWKIGDPASSTTEECMVMYG